MTPKEYWEIRKKLDAEIDKLSMQIMDAYRAAYACPPPAHLRPATGADVVDDAIIWYPEHEQSWVVVSENILTSPSTGQPVGFWFEGQIFDLNAAFVEVTG